MTEHKSINHKVLILNLLLILMILLLGGIGLLNYPDTLTQYGNHLTSFVVGTGLFVLAVLVIAGYVERLKLWLGLIVFSLLWTVFPLLKVIKHRFIDWQADELLITIDKILWGGQILPAYFRYENYGLLTDVLAGCYFLFFFLVVGAVIFYSKQRHTDNARRFFEGLFWVYGLGMIGYFLLPAKGPAFYHLPDGGAVGAIAQSVIAIVKQGVTEMDVFPSLHTAVTLFVVGFLWYDGHKKAALVLLPIAIGIVLATIFLRYHYGVDMLVGVVLAMGAVWAFRSKLYD